MKIFWDQPPTRPWMSIILILLDFWLILTSYSWFKYLNGFILWLLCVVWLVVVLSTINYCNWTFSGLLGPCIEHTYSTLTENGRMLLSSDFSRKKENNSLWTSGMYPSCVYLIFYFQLWMAFFSDADFNAFGSLWAHTFGIKWNFQTNKICFKLHCFFDWLCLSWQLVFAW